MSDPATRAVLSDASLLAARQHHFTSALRRRAAGSSMEITRGHWTVMVADVDPSELTEHSKEAYVSQV